MKLFDKIVWRIRSEVVKRRELNVLLRLAEKVDLNSAGKAPVMVVIAMPGCIHLTLCCIAHLPADRRIVVIANFCSDAEVEILSSLNIDVYEAGDFNMPHSKIIEALLLSGCERFWLVDHDCFLREKSFLTEIEDHLSSVSSIGVSVFSEGCGLGLNSSGIATFLMCIDPVQIKAVRSKYHADVGVVSWGKMSRRSRKTLLRLQVKKGTYPQQWKGYFDTFRLIDALAHHDDKQFIRSHKFGALFHLNDCAVHLGQTSQVFWPDDLNKKKYAAVGAFGSQLLFERMSDFYTDINGGKLGQLPSSSVMSKLLVEKEVLNADEMAYFDALSQNFNDWLTSRFPE